MQNSILSRQTKDDQNRVTGIKLEKLPKLPWKIVHGISVVDQNISKQFELFLSRNVLNIQFLIFFLGKPKNKFLGLFCIQNQTSISNKPSKK